ncbi:MAG: hypothetical protein CVU11_07700 [Bacteroidetes bacterium HGW-Bacteroidetes-6]|jgi:hypothetical protein|nr:MAG: hypothetical protein CVU11_07700 [Bacteroidetes bacterium HGW-Bacteroidetes-6]
MEENKEIRDEKVELPVDNSEMQLEKATEIVSEDKAEVREEETAEESVEVQEEAVVEEKTEIQEPEAIAEEVVASETPVVVEEQPDVLSEESVFASGESNYQLEDVIPEKPEDTDEHEDELAPLDFSEYEKYDLEQLKDEALRLIQQAEDITVVRPAFLKLRELHNALVDVEQQRIGELPDDDEEALGFKEEIDKKSKEFGAIWGIFQEKRKEHFEDQARQMEENHEKKLALLEDLKKLIDSEEPLKNTFDEFKKIQESWREIGMVPKDKNNDLWLSYNHHVQLFLDKVKLNRELRDLDMKKNLEIKVELCEKAEELILEKSVHEAFKRLQDLHRIWKETGPVPGDVKDEIWDRFRNASEKIREIRIGHYEDLNKKFEANYEAKQALVEKARNIASAEFSTMKQWNSSTKEMNELFDLWRSIGPAPKEHNEKVWTDFKSILDAFYAARKEYFNTIRQELNENYNKKLNICLEAEALKDNSDWRKTSQDLIRLQNEWKKVGPVHKIKSDILWKRFRTACDDFFNRKKAYFENINAVESENMQKKLDLINELGQHTFSDNNKENLVAIHEFQRRWFDAGRVPIEKKDELQSTWNKKIDEILSQLKISRFETENVRFKERMDSISASDDGRDKMWQEVKRIRFNVSKMEQDVQLWENNMGFFASSKNADILLKEFKEKIEKAKVDIKVMKEKEKYLQNLIDEKKK